MSLLRKKVVGKIKGHLELIHLRSLTRARLEEHRKYSSWPYRLISCFVMLILIYAAYLSFDPGKKLSVYGELKKSVPEKFILVTHGKLLHATGEPPFLNVSEVHEVKFNEQEGRWLRAREIFSSDEDLRDFWYSFDVDLRGTKQSFWVSQESVGILLPRIFGKITLYRNGEKVDFRQNYWPLVGLTREQNRIDVHVRTASDDFHNLGIRALYPAIVGDFSELEQIVKYIDRQLERFKTALVMQIIALMVICGLAASGPLMAELFPLILFFGINIIDCGLTYTKETGILPIVLWSSKFFAAKCISSNLQGFILIWSLCEFFRLDSETIRHRLKLCFTGWLLWEACSAFVVFKVFQIDEPWAVLIAGNFLFFAISTAGIVGDCFLYVLVKLKWGTRTLLSLILMASVYYFFVQAIVNYLHLTKQLTSEFTIQFHYYLVISIITATELGRSHRQRYEQGKVLVAEQMRLETQTRVIESQKLEVEFSRRQYQFAAQIAHDIRSPLATLNAIVHNSEGVEGLVRNQIKGVVARIQDIANNLLRPDSLVAVSELDQRSSYKSGQGDNRSGLSKEASEDELISLRISSITSEKRLQLSSRKKVEVYFEENNLVLPYFVKVQRVEFGRVLSNLIDNAIEAIGESGTVAVELKGDDQQVQIFVEDDGVGMAPEILSNIGTRGFTYGKDGMQSGSGLGVNHAMETVKSWGGHLTYETEEGRGTKAIITLPRAKAPEWFAESISITYPATIIVLDDDPSMREAWEDRFRSVALGQVRVICFASSRDLIQWYRETLGEIENPLYLCDHELGGNELKGLEVIEMLGVATEAILVTHKWDDPEVRSRCLKLGVRLLPKRCQVAITAGCLETTL